MLAENQPLIRKLFRCRMTYVEHFMSRKVGIILASIDTTVMPNHLFGFEESRGEKGKGRGWPRFLVSFGQRELIVLFFFLK
jgi:hypothetical protein